MQLSLTRILDVLADLGVRALVFAAVVVALFVAYRVVRALVSKIVSRAGVPLPAELALPVDEREVRISERRRRLRTVAAFGLRLVRWVFYVTILMLAISSFTPGLWDAIGGLGVGFGVAIGGAIGFGAQQMVRDYLNGVLILGENPYGVGDVIAIAGVKGTVEDVNLRRTVIRDADGTVHSVPNGAIIVASNFTRTFARINERIVVAYNSDIERATSLINEIGQALADDPVWGPRILDVPHVARVEAIADPGIPILIAGTIRPGEQWAVAGELRRRIVDAFRTAGIELATSRRLILDDSRFAPLPGEDAGDGGADST